MPKKSPKSPVLNALREACESEQAAAEFFERQRWGDEPSCPRCGSVNVYKMARRYSPELRDEKLRWRCRDCKRQYSVRTGLVLEESRLPLTVWVHAFWRASASKKGVSALQISRECEISYKSALFLMHRIRYAMAGTGDGSKLSGTVEVDETYIGGKPRHSIRKVTDAEGNVRDYLPDAAKPGGSDKIPVVALVERGGQVRARPVKRVDAASLRGAVHELVERGSTIHTDENPSYKALGATGYKHEWVTHTRKEYVRGDVTTNTVEGFFALLKRGVFGTFHSVSKHHLHRYVEEFAFKWNTRKLNDGERVLAAIRGAEGKRLLYAEPAV